GVEGLREVALDSGQRSNGGPADHAAPARPGGADRVWLAGRPVANGTLGSGVGLGGDSPPSELLVDAARAAGSMSPGTFRVVAQDAAVHVNDFPTIEAARKHADDVASEDDDIPAGAFIFDSLL